MCKCPLCKRETLVKGIDALNMKYAIQCDNCGNYYITDKGINCSESRKDTYLLSGYCRNAFNDGKIVTIDSKNIDDIVESVKVYNSPKQKVIQLIKYLVKSSSFYGEQFNIENSPAICFAKNEMEMQTIISLACDQGFLKFFSKGLNPTENTYILTAKSFEIEEDITNEKSKNAFVAMWFNDEFQDAYENGIKAAIEDPKCGQFQSVRIDRIEHNNDITDQIIAEIKKSRFVVADMSGCRGGVYYEAGYAKALGIPVIFTCKKDWFEGEQAENGIWIKEKIHFDINHQNIIVWETVDELKERLINRIMCTIK